MKDNTRVDAVLYLIFSFEPGMIDNLDVIETFGVIIELLPLI